MGNPSIRPQIFTGNNEITPTEHNGILAWVPADFMGREQLPEAHKDAAPEVKVVSDVPGIGPVVITHTLRSYSYRRSGVRWGYLPSWAEEKRFQDVARLRTLRWRD